MHNTNRCTLSPAEGQCGELKFAESWACLSASTAFTWRALNQDEWQRLAAAVIHTFLQMGSRHLQKDWNLRSHGVQAAQAQVLAGTGNRKRKWGLCERQSVCASGQDLRGTGKANKVLFGHCH